MIQRYDISASTWAENVRVKENGEWCLASDVSAIEAACVALGEIAGGKPTSAADAITIVNNRIHALWAVAEAAKTYRDADPQVRGEAYRDLCAALAELEGVK